MPQYRPDSSEVASPQNNYPVWYFFYGTLADQDVLGRLFGTLDDSAQYELRPASITGTGSTRLWWMTWAYIQPLKLKGMLSWSGPRRMKMHSDIMKHRHMKLSDVGSKWTMMVKKYGVA